MFTSIRNKIEELTQKYPGWDQKVAAFFEDGDVHEDAYSEDMLDLFANLITSLLDMIKGEKIPVEDAIKLLDDYVCKDYANKYIRSKMQSYYNYAPLRELAEEDIYKAKCCVDIIWSSYILRFNPNLVFDDSVPLNETNFKNIAAQLDRFTDFCIDRSFTFSAIVQELRETTDFDEVLCKYIAEKIDDSFEKLKLNYIIHRLSIFERTLDDIAQKQTGK